MKEQSKDIQYKLIKASRSWALMKNFDPLQAQELRREAILLNHLHYLDNIPVYRRITEEEGCGKDADIQTIKTKMMLSADIFKSYEQSWLDEGDYDRMNKWLSGIFHKRIDADMTDVMSIDEWIERLDTIGINVNYSSGTSGSFSFVPRDKEDWELSQSANIAYLTPLLASRIMNKGLSNHLLNAFVKFMPMSGLLKTTGKKALPDYDAAFLGFKTGNMGNQVLIREFVPLFNNHYFLYDIGISGTALRCLRRGAHSDYESNLAKILQEKMIEQREENYIRLANNIENSTNKGQKICIFGAPYQFKELCEILTANNRKLDLKDKSLAIIGGGWKSFSGEAISHDVLVDIIDNTLNVSPEMILEGYSMTETSALTLRCRYGRFHIPPIIEPLIFDNALNPIEGNDIKGAFGFMDTLTSSHPGFLISNDYVHMVNSDCECGQCGPSILEIGRLPGSEVKGCGGIMGSFSA